jgi:hypothetical protein
MSSTTSSAIAETFPICSLWSICSRQLLNLGLAGNSFCGKTMILTSHPAAGQGGVREDAVKEA